MSIGMIRLLYAVFVIIVLWYITNEIRNVRKRAKAEDRLNEIKAEMDVFSMEKEAVQLERQLEEEKEELYREEEEAETKTEEKDVK